MGDHLALLVDHLLTESTLEAAIGGQKHDQIASDSAPLEDPGKEFTRKRNIRDRSCVGKLVECRICQEEEEDYNMEIPCSCCGSLKYAHRECVQRWCNEKGDTVCEICLQQFKPGYTAPQKLFQYGSIPMNFRGNWEITRQDLNDSQILTLYPSERDVMHPHDDDYSALGMRTTVCCQSVAIIFMVLLVLRHTLPLAISGAEHYSFTIFSLLVLRTAGILVPVFVLIRTIRTFHQCQHQQLMQGTREVSDRAEGTHELSSWQLVQSQPHRIQVH